MRNFLTTFSVIPAKAGNRILAFARMTGKRARMAVANQRGYTVVELVVAMSIFAIVLVTAVGSFVSVSRSSSKSATQRGVQQDIRFNLEEMARQTRSSSIDYNFYKTPDARCQVATGRVLALLYTEAGTDNAPQSSRVVFYYDAAPGREGIYKYTASDAIQTPTCDAVLTNGSNTKLTADSVRINDARFYITPDISPQDPALVVSDPRRGIHPRVKIVATVETAGAVANTDPTRESRVTLQTTVSSRAYPLTKVFGRETPPPVNPTPLAPIALNGRNYATCQVANRADYCRSSVNNIDANSVSALSGGGANPPFVLTYSFTGVPPGTYRLRLTYLNEQYGGLPVPPNYSYNVLSTINGAAPGVQYTLPTTQPGTAPRTFEAPGGAFYSGTVTVSLSWDNDLNAGGDANFGLRLIELVPV